MRKKLVKLIYKLGPGVSSAPVLLTDIGMTVTPGEPFEVAPKVAEYLMERSKGRIAKVEPEPEEPDPKAAPSAKKTKKAKGKN